MNAAVPSPSAIATVRQQIVVEFAPGERHEVLASSNARLLLLLTPWPGTGHPGAMTIREKLYARRHAAKRASEEHRAADADTLLSEQSPSDCPVRREAVAPPP